VAFVGYQFFMKEKPMPIILQTDEVTQGDVTTEVTATATIEPLINGTYEIAYALIGDELTGTASSWKQSNNYATRTPAQWGTDDPYLTPFCKGGKYGSTKVILAYDDVLLASSYVSGTNKAKIDPLQEGKVVTNTYTLTLPTKTVLKEAIEKAGYTKLAVIAMIIRNDGKIENAAKFYLSNDPAGVENLVNIGRISMLPSSLITVKTVFAIFFCVLIINSLNRSSVYFLLVKLAFSFISEKSY